MLKLIFFLIATTFLCSISLAQTNNIAKSKTFIELLSKQDFSKAHSYFSEEFKSQLNLDTLQKTWETINSQVGKFKQQSETLSDKNPVVITCEFQNLSLDVQISFDKENKINGLFFAPTKAKEKSEVEYQKPSYANTELFEEKEVTVGTGEWTVPATLTIPKGKTKLSAIVLVHGSGPNDRDETIGPNKVFKDLAWGLASKGIAVLRYDKRTRVHGAKFGKLKNQTVNEETVDDAVLAVELLRQTPNVDKKNIYVLGHSLGGMMIPRIGVKGKNIKGFVVFAGSTRFLPDVILEQYKYIFSLEGDLTTEKQAVIKNVENDVATVNALKPADINSDKIYLGVPASYWLDLKSYNPPILAKSLKQPMLVLQGERDYQVTMKDFQNWKDALGKKKNATFKTYPTLTHSFMEGSPKPGPKDYEKAGNVNENVVNDIANWIIKTAK
jgi:uncharacterized protein